MNPDDSWSETQADNNITVRFTDIHGESTEDVVLEVTVTNNDTVFVDSATGVELADTYVHEVTFYEDQGYQSFDVMATDEAQGTSWYEIIVDPTWPSDILDWLAIDAATGLVYTTGDGPENAQVSEDGAWEFTIRHHDSHGSTDDLAVKITVVNDSPEFVATSDIWFSLEGGEQSFDLHTTDETSDNEGADPTGLSNQYDFSAVDPAFDGTIDIDAHSGVITLYSAPSAAGDYSFTVGFLTARKRSSSP